MVARVLVFVASLLTTACALPTFPTKAPLPYSQGEFLGVAINSTHDEVVAHMGQPQLRLQDDRLWVYGRTRIKSSGFGQYNHDYRAILVEFNEGKVTSKDVFHQKKVFLGGCWGKNRELCLHPAWDSTSGSNNEPKKLSRRYSSVTSLRQGDKNAKLFKPVNGLCSIYIYTAANLFEDRQSPPIVTLESIKDEPVPSEGYAYFQSRPRPLMLTTGDNSTTIDCQASKLHFYELKHHMFNADGNTRIKPVDNAKGREAILKRRLILNW